MGIITQGKGLWNALFTRTQRQLLGLFFGYPERSFYANELVRRAGVGTGSVQRGLARLADAGLVTVKRIGNQKHYQANPESPIYPELRNIVLKTFGATGRLRQVLGDLPGHVQLALLFSEADPAVTETRLLLVSDDLEIVEVQGGLADAEDWFGRGIRPLVMSSREYRARQDRGDEELLAILARPKVLLIGSIEPSRN